MTRIPFGAKFVDKNSTRLLIFLLLLMKLEPLAQLVEHRPFKAGVPGSTPGRLTIFRGLRCPSTHRLQAAECRPTETARASFSRWFCSPGRTRSGGSVEMNFNFVSPSSSPA